MGVSDLFLVCSGWVVFSLEGDSCDGVEVIEGLGSVDIEEFKF